MGSCDVAMVETSAMSQLELPKIASSSDVTFGHEKMVVVVKKDDNMRTPS